MSKSFRDKLHDYKVALFGVIAAMVLPYLLFSQKIELGKPAARQVSRAFASDVLAFEHGHPLAISTERNPENLLGAPDYKDSGDGKAYSLGCSGQVTLGFGNRVLVDAEGDDLRVIEVGEPEPYRVFLSDDGDSWVEVLGHFDKDTTIDLRGQGLNGSYQYVKLIDADPDCKEGRWPGADFDAVIAINSIVE